MEVCIVGYAMHAKKMRKGVSVGKAPQLSGEWCGGGLADILNSGSLSQGVLFKPFSHETSNVSN